jgi:hypothetical protein
MNGTGDDARLSPAPQRPRWRWKDISRFGGPPPLPLDRANPTHPAGSDPRRHAALLQLEASGSHRRRK